VPYASVRYPRYGTTELSADELTLLDREYKQPPNVVTTANSQSDSPIIGRVSRVDPLVRGALVYGEHADMRVQWAAADCLHVSQMTKSDGRTPQSGIVQPTLQPTTSPLTLEAVETDDGYRMATGAVECFIRKQDGRLSVQLGDGTPSFVEVRPATLHEGKSVRFALQMTPDTLCVGFGARVQPPDLRGALLRLYPGLATGVIAPVPFALLVSPKASCGVYWRTSARMLADVSGARAGEMVVEIEESRLEYFIMIGHSPVAVLARLASLFPPSPLPPLWGLGMHVGGEALDSAESLFRIMREFQMRDLPCTAAQVGATAMDGGRPLTVNAQRFPDLSGMVDQLHAQGTQVVLEMHPAIHIDPAYPLYTNGRGRGIFISYADGSPVRGAAAGRMSVFPDFMRDDARAWWSEQMRPLVRAGIDGVGTYNAGPDVDFPAAGAALPDAALHQVGGESVTHPAVRSFYAEQMAEACRVGLDKHRGALRPFVRVSGGAPDPSKQSFLTIETGTDWDSLRIALRAVLNANVSGFQLTGLEIDAHDGEFMARALQVGCLMPSLLIQTRHGGTGLPWSFGDDVEGICRDVLHLRNRLMSYLYTCIALAREYGVPVLRPLWMHEPDNASSYDVEDEFLIGDHVLVAPVLSPGAHERSVLLPEGLWYDYWTNRTLTGGARHQASAPLHRLPLFVRAGTVLNHATGSTDDVGGQIRIYPGNSDATSYDDPGEGFSYLHGDYRWVYYTCAWETSQCFVVNRRRTGGFFPSDKRMRIEVVGLKDAPDEVRLDRHGAPLWYFDQGILEIVADDETGRIEVWLDGSPTSPTRKRRAL
jgi:alpha-glucosidase